MAIDNNPLKQYFRRPAIYIRLPSGGKGYGPEVLTVTETGELPVYPMTAIDEITIKTPDALFNGEATAELIRSCLPNIKDPWAISSIDLDSILVGIKVATGGQELEVNSTCPKCNEEGTYRINLVTLLGSMKAGDYEKELPIGDLVFKFKPLSYKEMNKASLGQFDLQRTFMEISDLTDEDEKRRKTKEALVHITEVTMDVLSHTIEYIRTPAAQVSESEFILDFLHHCDRNVYIQIRDYNADLKRQTEIKPLQIVCVNCKHEYEQPFTLNTSDFFA